MFGWLEITGISDAAPVNTFLDARTKRDCGCEGWSDKNYVDRWCDGDLSKLVRKIDFIYHSIDSYSASDYAIAANKVKEVAENYHGSLKPRRDTSWKLSTPLSTKLPHADDYDYEDSPDQDDDNYTEDNYDFDPVDFDDYRDAPTAARRTTSRRTSPRKQKALPMPPGPTPTDVAATAAAAASEAVKSAVQGMKEAFAKVSAPQYALPAPQQQPQPVVAAPAPQLSLVDTKYEQLLLGLVQEQKEERAYRRQMDLIAQNQRFFMQFATTGGMTDAVRTSGMEMLRTGTTAILAAPTAAPALTTPAAPALAPPTSAAQGAQQSLPPPQP